ncbi:hypothetical protein EDD86DRAFT_239495 [Gorgonomyces haynaldii]|nr:hypothetical protein EDD86DRAFT_239495 [Gorgonomyces haynaldii]
MHWVPLESNPDVLNEYITNLGVQRCSFSDIWGLDDDALQFVPQPVRSVLVLFPITPQYQEIRKQRTVVHNDLFFFRQFIGNACGTIGVLHALTNNMEHLDCHPSSTIAQLYEKYKNADPTVRGHELEHEDRLAAAHEQSSMMGQTEAPAADADVDLHFVCFVERSGRLFELDGNNEGPVDHGPCTNILQGTARVVRDLVEVSGGSVQFSLLAFGGQ